jgi:hypothetical protein
VCVAVAASVRRRCGPRECTPRREIDTRALPMVVSLNLSLLIGIVASVGAPAHRKLPVGSNATSAPRRGSQQRSDDAWVNRRPTLVVLVGEPRGGSATHAALRTHVLEPWRADLALFFGDIFAIPPTLASLAKYIWRVQEPRDWTGVWDEVAMDLGLAPDAWRTALDRTDDIEHRGLDGASIFGPVVHRNRSVHGSSTISGAFGYWLYKRHHVTLKKCERESTTHEAPTTHPPTRRCGADLFARGR